MLDVPPGQPAPHLRHGALKYDRDSVVPVICRHFGVCGGCQTQDVAYPEQLARKRRALQVLLRSVAGTMAPDVQPVVAAAAGGDGMPRHFRHKAAFVFAPADRGGGLVMGHFAASSRRVIPVTECPVHSDRANRLAFALRDRLARAAIPAAGPRLDGILRHVVVRTTSDEQQAIVLLVVTRNDRSLRRPLRAWLDSDERPDGLFVSEHARDDPFLIGDRPLHIGGLTRVREAATGTPMLISPAAFFQTNPAAARALVDEVLDATAGCPAPDARVLDLYAGAGLFALPLARRGHRVVAVEENPQAVKDGIANAALNRIARSRLSFVADRTEAYLRRRQARPDAVVIDPPRQGCGSATVDLLFGAMRPPLAIYVSCNPAAFAGELPAILRAGYRLERVLPVDMFPHTTHVELVATLRAPVGF